jgi:Sec-independent protein translocase protein TatA
MIGIPEAVVIIVVIGIFFFGKDKVIDWAKTFGQAKREFKASKEEIIEVIK